MMLFVDNRSLEGPGQPTYGKISLHESASDVDGQDLMEKLRQPLLFWLTLRMDWARFSTHGQEHLCWRRPPFFTRTSILSCLTQTAYLSHCLGYRSWSGWLHPSFLAELYKDMDHPPPLPPPLPPHLPPRSPTCLIPGGVSDALAGGASDP